MELSEEVEKLDSIFIDTAPIIYHIEAHPVFGMLMRKIVDILETKSIGASSSSDHNRGVTQTCEGWKVGFGLFRLRWEVDFLRC